MFILKRATKSPQVVLTNLCRSIFWFGINEKGRSLDMIKPSKKKKGRNGKITFNDVFFLFYFFFDDDDDDD